METHLAPEFQDTPEGAAAEDILRKCVHCGFCTATCPTYQLLGDELDGPRGRIYLIKQLLEGAEVSRSTQVHLDRCLTCRNCESTCPSGVRYGELVEIGREIVERKVSRPLAERLQRSALRHGLGSPLFPLAVKAGKAVRPLLPASLANKLPAVTAPTRRPPPHRRHERKVLMLAGCVQPALAPNINEATVRVLDAAGIETVVAAGAGCCGAMPTHLGDAEAGRAAARRNIDAWWPLVDPASPASAGVEAIISNASACGLAVKEYGHALGADPSYRDRAQHIASLARDLSELLAGLLPTLHDRVRADPARPLVFHPPCTLQHGQRLRGGVESGLRGLGFTLTAPPDEAHLCCGSAGPYSVLHPEIAVPLRDRKLTHLTERHPAMIVTANIGCMQHLQSGTPLPVRHWVEVVDEALVAS